jgi:hypothetical protein
LHITCAKLMADYYCNRIAKGHQNNTEHIGYGSAYVNSGDYRQTSEE